MARRIGSTGKDSGGKRVNVYLKPEHQKIAKDIDNLSEFFQIALEQAAQIMAFDIIKKTKGLESPPPTPEQTEQWNMDHPLDPLTAKRLGKEKQWPNTPLSQSKPEPW